ncbi:MAG: hypothetical protein KBT13_05255, partial [Bacteroidales bacterium]|nr:hypothetical protein [Candidatus Sodaliphilus limicaballi]
ISQFIRIIKFIKCKITKFTLKIKILRPPLNLDFLPKNATRHQTNPSYIQLAPNTTTPTTLTPAPLAHP